MSDSYRRTNAILAAYRDQYSLFMSARRAVAELLPVLTPREEAQYRRIQNAVDGFNIDQQSRHEEVLSNEPNGFTVEEKLESVARLLAVTEQITDRLKHFTDELIELVQRHDR
jgi:hypothetical protein